MTRGRGVLAWGLTAGLAVLGAARLSRGWVALVLAGAGSMAAMLWTWWRFQADGLKERLGTTFLAWFGGFMAWAWIGAYVDRGGLAAAAVIAGAVTVAAARSRWQLRGGPVPAEGEARGRVWFQGTAHAVAGGAVMPGADRAVVAWVARQLWRRWASGGRFEVRDGARRVLVESAAMLLAGRTWKMRGALGRAAARTLGDRASTDRVVRMRYLSEGDMVHVVGVARLVDDAAAPGYRDPGRISLFSGALVVGEGGLAAARQRAAWAVLGWGVLAMGAGVGAVWMLVR